MASPVMAAADKEATKDYAGLGGASPARNNNKCETKNKILKKISKNMAIYTYIRLTI